MGLTAGSQEEPGAAWLDMVFAINFVMFAPRNLILRAEGRRSEGGMGVDGPCGRNARAQIAQNSIYLSITSYRQRPLSSVCVRVGKCTLLLALHARLNCRTCSGPALCGDRLVEINTTFDT